MKLSDIQASWALDATIDLTDLGRSAAANPSLHAKYARLWSQARLQARKKRVAYLQLVRTKTRYYRGEFTREEYLAHNLPPYNLKHLKSEIAGIVEGDEDVIQITTEMEYVETTRDFLESILKAINTRSYDVKNAVTWVTFTNGVS